MTALISRLWVIAEDTPHAADETADRDEAGEQRKLARDAQAFGDRLDARLIAQLDR